MQRITVTDSGVQVYREEPPLVSMYGKVMRQGHTWDDLYPWPEITRVSLSLVLLPPDDSRWIELDIDFPNGHFTSVSHEADGFEEAVREFAARAGNPHPDLSTLEGIVTVWPNPAWPKTAWPKS